MNLGTVEPAAKPGDSLRWSRFLPATAAEGPGLRSALWVQGCSVHCPGCFNPQLWAEIGGRLEDTAALADSFVADAQAAGVEGVTLLGGEPFDQAAALASVAEAFSAAGLTVMTFSGYPLDLLTAWSATRPDIARLLAATDLLIDGPYLRDQPDAVRPWLGSTNQGIRALTPAYADEVARIERGGGLDRLEIRIHPDGQIDVNGWADSAALEDLLHDLGRRHDRPLPERPRTKAKLA
ncbi:4Fe-4S single cluster domain-containing protein [Cryobacterium sp. SO2]|uniref:4Fe-4S single cluster domain-containing protein n=1 Tax=Cryobacterium sp. SO2 TaxID=1897060 RepID=UPI00223DCB45|nr:4Fe-4S single cluster domain-containing protein [Cryobacterium sp. SO2]WEO77194.1 4Fe-4S single cluster domain-containing protein [Cryobacterium sp. SO2]